MALIDRFMKKFCACKCQIHKEKSANRPIKHFISLNSRDIGKEAGGGGGRYTRRDTERNIIKKNNVLTSLVLYGSTTYERVLFVRNIISSICSFLGFCLLGERSVWL
jgi:hypothetical protein